MRILDIEQRSPEWYAARCGVPTASDFGSIITAKKMEYAAAAETYINSLIDEMVRPQADGGFAGNRHTVRGTELEPEAADLYAFMTDVELTEVGFILNDEGTLGCSPDRLVGDEGGVEIKCPDGPTHVKWVRAGVLLDEHKAQVHGSLIITGRKWWDFFSHCPGYEPLLIRVYPDAFTETLRKHLDRFVADYAKARIPFINKAA